MFVVCGEALFDVFLEGDVAPASPMLPLSARVGGSPFNVAIGLARLGRPAALLTGLSTDFLGDRLAAVLAAENVSDRLVVRKSAPTTLGLVSLSRGGAPAYAFYGDGAADRALTAADLPADLGRADCLHFGSYALVAPPTADALATLATREKGRRFISLDPNVRANVEPDIDLWRERVALFAAAADLIKISDEDMALLYPGADPERQAADWLTGGARAVAFTQAERGVTVWTAETRVDTPAASVEVVDTVGAGDAFQAALLSALRAEGAAEPWDAKRLTDAARFATAAAALTCARRGADLPRRHEIEAFLSKTPT